MNKYILIIFSAISFTLIRCKKDKDFILWIINRTDTHIDPLSFGTPNKVLLYLYFVSVSSHDSIQKNLGDPPTFLYYDIVTKDTVIRRGRIIMDNSCYPPDYDPTNPTGLEPGNYALVVDSIKTSINPVRLFKR